MCWYLDALQLYRALTKERDSLSNSLYFSSRYYFHRHSVGWWKATLGNAGWRSLMENFSLFLCSWTVTAVLQSEAGAGSSDGIAMFSQLPPPVGTCVFTPDGFFNPLSLPATLMLRLYVCVSIHYDSSWAEVCHWPPGLCEGQHKTLLFSIRWCFLKNILVFKAAFTPSTVFFLSLHYIFWSRDGENSAAPIAGEQREFNSEKKCKTFQPTLRGRRSVRQSYSCQKQPLG